MSMQAKYWIAKDEYGLDTQHIGLEHMLIADEDRSLCDAEKPQFTKSKRDPKVDICSTCKENFIKSDHPEAIAYRSMFT